MRSDAKASTAGSTQGRAGRLGSFLRGALATRDASPRAKGSGAPKARWLVVPVAALALLLALAVGPASGSTTRFLQEVFGSSAEPSFSADRGMVVDQETNQLYVIDSTEDAIRRFNANGTDSNFGALGSNAIDGEGTGDETPLGHLAFESNRQREQIALDESGEASDGNVYVTQSAKDVVDIFNSAGEYLGQLTESTGTGAFGEPCGVAVDAEGTVYVGDRGDDRIHVFDPAAAVPVNADNTASYETVTDPCTLAAGVGPTAGFLFVDASTGAQLRKVDAATGEVKYEIATGASTVSVDPASGHLFVARNTGSSSTVDEYDASGGAEASLVSSFKPGSTVEGVAVNGGSEEVYVSRSSTSNVEVFGPALVIPDVVTEPVTSNTGTRATLAGTVNPDGVELDECFFEWGAGLTGEYTETTLCAETPAEIGTGTSPVAVHADLTGLIPQGKGYHYRLVAVNPTATINGSNQSFSTPATVSAAAASGLTSTEATLNGTVNPDTATISECLFEWGPEAAPNDAFQALPETAPCVPSPAGESPVAVHADLTGLHPGTTYVYRLKATYPTGAIINPGGEKTLSATTAGPVIAATWAEDVAYTEAAIKTEINPRGSATTYRIEYGPTAAYGSETEEIGIGSDSTLHKLSRFFDGLEAGATLHYRVVATNGVAENVGPDLMLTTFERPVLDTDCPNQDFRIGAAARLPECRAYEMVSPLDKAGGEIDPRTASLGEWRAMEQAAADGEKMAYGSSQPFGDVASGLEISEYIASRGAGGWTTHAISPPHQKNTEIFVDQRTPGRYSAFTEDLTAGFLYDNAKPPLTTDALGEGYYNNYLWHSGDTFETLTTERFSAGEKRLGGMGLQGYGKDGEYVFFLATAQLTPDAPPGAGKQLYRYHNGELELVSVLPGGEPDSGGAYLTAGAHPGNIGFTHSEVNETRNAISADGSRVVWTDGAGLRIFVWIDGQPTVPVSESVVSPAEGQAFYWGASSDGSQVVFAVWRFGTSLQESKLYRFDVDTETATLIAEESDRRRSVLGVSNDGARVFFLSPEALAPGAVVGRTNLYLDDEGTKTFIAALANSDQGPGSYGTANNDEVRRDFSYVTADGRYLFFQSLADLTGYDNRSANHLNESATEIYRYDADAEELLCVSCNPSGARPLTNVLPAPNSPLAFNLGVQAAAWLPTPVTNTYMPRMLAKDGSRIFFHANDALVPEDSNGVQDVYEWVAPGVEGCGEADGCVSLISTGTSSDPAMFMDANEGQRDVFFRTRSSIEPGDLAETYDVYDARIGGGFPHAAPTPECFGDACQSVPEPPNDPTPASAGFRGAGDPTPAPNCGVQAKRAAKLSRRAKALRRRAKQAKTAKQAKALRKRSARYAKRAKSLSRRAARCRRSTRRAGR